jgi:predicted metal-dependent HD superfamily phosphohydrolase
MLFRNHVSVVNMQNVSMKSPTKMNDSLRQAYSSTRSDHESTGHMQVCYRAMGRQRSLLSDGIQKRQILEDIA